MKTNCPIPSRFVWLIPATIVVVIGIKTMLLADSGHPPVPETVVLAPVKPSATYSAPAGYNGIEKLRNEAVPGEPLDEPMGGKTMKGTPITPRTPACFPAESRDLFWRMDMVSSGPNSPLQPLNFDKDGNGRIDDKERDAIRGRNTWLLWGGGNEGFWNWLAQDGYGITDFLVLLDSRARGTRFKDKGVINQPGYQANSDPSKKILGLYLDQPVPERTKNSDLPDKYASFGHRLSPPPWEDSKAGYQHQPAGHEKYQRLTPTDPKNEDARVLAEQSELFEAGDQELFNQTVMKLAALGDGVDYTVYGFPTGIFGLRLFLNPDFFGKTKAAEVARAYWKKQVMETNDRYYSDQTIQQDPNLVRPFRISVSCGFCHIGPHPLNPPTNFEKPDWANLSSNIGAQYWKPQPAFGNLQTGNSFLFHFLASQQPGTVDTSLVSTDHINNANTMNGVFDINARLARAGLNSEERQSVDNVRVKSIEDLTRPINHDGKDWRHTPRVLVDGSDSIGAFGALARVYLNIGTFYEEWSRCHNPLIGFIKQRPFRLETCQKNSVYWKVNEDIRTNYLAAYFTLKYNATTQKPVTTQLPPSVEPHTSTQPMKLAAAKEPNGEMQNIAAKKAFDIDTPERRIRGREVWLESCAICHSSKQPDGFGLTFARKAGGEKWDTQSAPKDANYLLPMDENDWGAFKRSPAYADYKARLMKLVTGSDPLCCDPLTDGHRFWKDNFLSSEIRIPVTLVGTNSSRSMATNGIAGNVWDNFSSLTYKELPAVGAIGYFNPISKRSDVSYQAPAGGRGYYRPATHISLWATAPYLHNNSLGVFIEDPSVKGRLVQFMDGIRRMLWVAKRPARTLQLSAAEFKWLDEVQASDANKIAPDLVVSRPGDLRGTGASAAAGDAGFIYRLPQDANIEFAAKFAGPLIEGIAGPKVTPFISKWLWIGLVSILLLLAWVERPRYLGIMLIFVAVGVAGLLALSGLGGGGSTIGVLVMGAMGLLELSSGKWWILAALLALLGIIFIQAKPGCDKSARWLQLLVLTGVVFAVARMTHSTGWTIVSALIALYIVGAWEPTLPGFSRAFFLLLAVAAAAIGWTANCFVNGRKILHIPLANINIGPLPVQVGPIPRGTPVNLMMSMDPESPKLPKAIVSMILATAEIKKKNLVREEAWNVFSAKAGQALMDASKCPDFVLDRGHLFGETLDPDPVKNDADKEALIAFLKTL